MKNIEELAVFCKKKGFVYPSSEIYGGIAGFWDLGPMGVELFSNIRQHWWKHFVQDREDMAGMDASIISNPKVWVASGHVDSFGDLILICKKCRTRHRADHFIEDSLGISADGMGAKEINSIIDKNGLTCPKCKGSFEELRAFNLLFETKVGAEEGKTGVAYLRGETAQGMFTDFKIIADTTRQKLPFGIAQVGRCFRNEISPRDFMFRSREFTIAEFEFFIHPDEKKCLLLDSGHRDVKVRLLDAETQALPDDAARKLRETTIGQMISEGKLDEWHGYWLAEQVMWFESLGLDSAKLKIREHTKTELSHYSSATFDLDYDYPFGSKELAGNANRGQYDLTQHQEHSRQNLTLFDEESKQKILPKVIEPTFGMERIFMAVLCDAYSERQDEKGNPVVCLKLLPRLAPTKVAVLPLVSKLDDKAREVFAMLKKEFTCFYDRSGAIGRRYVRQDELGTPYCVTIDFDTLEKDSSVTVRDRDTKVQERIKIDDLRDHLRKKIYR